MDAFRRAADDLLASPLRRAEKAKQLAVLIQYQRRYDWVGLYDVSAEQISALAWTGSEPPAFPVFPVSKGINGAAVAQRKPITVPDVTKDDRYLTTFGTTRSEAIFPVLSSDGATVLGTIDVESDRVNAFDAADEQFLSECAVRLRPLWEHP
ncbi:MAG TPA: GAF domain-containing protein [Thermoanaerobaculia bacterium]